MSEKINKTGKDMLLGLKRNKEGKEGDGCSYGWQEGKITVCKRQSTATARGVWEGPEWGGGQTKGLMVKGRQRRKPGNPNGWIIQGRAAWAVGRGKPSPIPGLSLD